MAGTNDDAAWLRSAASSDATDVAKPVVLPGSPPKPELSRVPPTALATIGVPMAQAGIRDPLAQLRLALTGLDLIPPVLSGAADVASPGVGKATGLSTLLGAGGEGLREGGYNLLGQNQYFGGGLPGLLTRMRNVGFGQGAATLVGRGLASIPAAIGRAPQDLGAAAFGGVPSGKVEGNFVKTGLRENIMPGPPLAFEGTDKLGRALQASHEAETRVGKQIAAQNPGLTLSRADIANGAFQDMLDREGAAMTAAEYKELNALRKAAASEKVPGVPKDLTVPDVLKFKQGYDRRLARLSNRPDPYAAFGASDVAERFQKAQADFARNWLHQLPPLSKNIARTQSLVQYADPLKWAESQAAVPATAGAFATARDMALTRENLGKAALAMRGPAATFGNRGAVMFASQLPRMLASGRIEKP